MKTTMSDKMGRVRHYKHGMDVVDVQNMQTYRCIHVTEDDVTSANCSLFVINNAEETKALAVFFICDIDSNCRRLGVDYAKQLSILTGTPLKAFALPKGKWFDRSEPDDSDKVE